MTVDDIDLPLTRPVADVELDWSAGDLPRPGDVFDEKYLLRARLGQGGMGVVYLAEDVRLGRHVAVKIVHPVIADDPELGGMFQREAESMARLRHPNVVEIYDIGRVGALRYLVMPYHEGANLTQWIEEYGGRPVPLSVATRLLVQICDALAEMHASNLVHGDIKPSNILVSPTLDVMLVDLGLSRPCWQLGDGGRIGGTPGYMAPELVARTPVEPHLASKIDVYALGVTAYGLLTGYMPPSAGRYSALAPVRDVRPSVRRPSLGEGFDALLLSAMDPNPEARPTIPELRAALLAGSDAVTRAVRPRVVVVDDDENALMLVSELVRAALDDPDILECRDSKAALAGIEREPPDLVITDLQMPGMNGVELTAILQGNPRTAEVPVVVLSGVGGAADWRVMQALGATCFLLKPVVPDILIDVVRRMVRERRP